MSSSYWPVASLPDDAFITFGTDARSYRDLRADVAALVTTVLARPAVAEREHVIVLCEDRYLFAVAVLAVWQAGHVVALPPNARDATVLRIRDELGAYVLHDTEHADGFDLRTLTPAEPQPIDAIAAERVIATLYTSGSTGDFQPCAKTARQIFGEVAVLAGVLGVTRGQRVVGTVPPHHLYGLLFTVLLPLSVGAELSRDVPLHAEAILERAASAAAAPALIVSVPAHIASFERLPAGALSQQRVVSSTAPLAAPVAHAVVARHPGVTLVEVFGSTETGGIALRHSAQERTWSPMPGVTVTEDAGQLVVDSPFAPERPYRTNDRVTLEQSGRFLHLGRVDDVVKVGGRRVSLGAIEARIGELAGVDDVKVVAVPEPGGRNMRILAALATNDPRWTPASLREALTEWLEVAAMPRRFAIVSRLPREANGKLARERVLQLFGPPKQIAVGAARAGAKPNERLFDVHVPVDSPHFDGHFPGYPILPGVALVHDAVLPALATTGVSLGRLEQITRLKFRRPVGPGEALTLRLVTIAERLYDFHLARGATACASGRLHFAEEANPTLREPGERS